MAWVAFDRAVRAVEDFGRDGPAQRWRRLRQEGHDDVCASAFDAERATFTQYYGSRELDAAALLMPSIGSANDPRVKGTVAAIERELLRGGFVQSYTDGDRRVAARRGRVPRLHFWLADAYARSGRTDDARATFERLLSLRNDVGLLAALLSVQRGYDTHVVDVLSAGPKPELVAALGAPLSIPDHWRPAARPMSYRVHRHGERCARRHPAQRPQQRRVPRRRAAGSPSRTTSFSAWSAPTAAAISQASEALALADRQWLEPLVRAGAMSFATVRDGFDRAPEDVKVVIDFAG